MPELDNRRSQRANIAAFFSEFWASWWTRMSGPLSVPLTIFGASALSFGEPSTPAKVLFALLLFTGIACGFQASFVVWRRAQRRAIELEERLAPKIIAKSLITREQSHKLYHKRQFIELEVENDSGEALPNCAVYVDAIQVGDETSPHTEHLPRALRTIRNNERGGSGPFNLRAGQRKIIPICDRVDHVQSEIFIAYEDQEPHPHWSYSLRDTRDCILKLRVYGAPRVTTIDVRLEVDHEGKLSARFAE